MDIIIKWPDSIVIRELSIFRWFLQGMANRKAVGALRYGDAKKEQLYLTRLTTELSAYKRTGNQEHLFNIANYCFLETITPEHPKSHFDPTAKSATRRQLGGANE